MHSGEGSFAAPPASRTRIVQMPERLFAVRHHPGNLDTIEETRRPLYQHMIMHELVGGPPVLRFNADASIDVLVGCTCGFEGDDNVAIERLPAGPYAVLDFEGPEDELDQARGDLTAWAEAQGHEATGPLLQVHMMDAIDGVMEQQMQLPVQPL